jgi:hypothetical protein
MTSYRCVPLDGCCALGSFSQPPGKQPQCFRPHCVLRPAQHTLPCPLPACRLAPCVWSRWGLTATTTATGCCLPRLQRPTPPMCLLTRRRCWSLSATPSTPSGPPAWRRQTRRCWRVAAAAAAGRLPPLPPLLLGGRWGCTPASCSCSSWRSGSTPRAAGSGRCRERSPACWTSTSSTPCSTRSRRGRRRQSKMSPLPRQSCGLQRCSACRQPCCPSRRATRRAPTMTWRAARSGGSSGARWWGQHPCRRWVAGGRAGGRLQPAGVMHWQQPALHLGASQLP